MVLAWQHLNDIPELTGTGSCCGCRDEVAEGNGFERDTGVRVGLLEGNTGSLETEAQTSGQIGGVPTEELDFAGGLLGGDSTAAKRRCQQRGNAHTGKQPGGSSASSAT